MGAEIELPGGVKVSVNVQDTGLWLDGHLAGEIVIAGGEADLSGRAITLRFREYWPQTRRLGGNEDHGEVHGVFDDKMLTKRTYHTRRKVELAGAFDLKRGAERRYDFATPFPRNGTCITTRDTGWVINVALDIPGDGKPVARFKLDVLPCGNTAAVLRTCESVLGFQEDLEHRRWQFHGKEARFRLAPPESLRAEFDHLDLRLIKNENGGLKGEMIFDLQEKKLDDYFRALLNRDKVAVPLSLSREQLTLPNGGFNTKAIAELVSSAIEKVIAERRR